jgi:hypothetical protein
MSASRPLELLRSSARSSAARWLLGLAILAVSSWARWFATGSLRIDENYPAELPGSLIYGALMIGWSLVVWGWVGLLKRPPERPRQLAYAGLAVMAFMLPMLSNDMYGLFTYAGLAIRGQDVYTTVQSLPSSVWFSWIGERWRDTPSPYGPVALLFAAGPSIAGEHQPLVGILLLRVLWYLPLIAVMELSSRVFRDRPFFHTMLWLNPLILLEGAGQLHLDLLGAMAITAGLIAQSTGPRIWGAVGWAGATLCKWNDVITAPWFWLAGARTWGQRLKSLGLMAVVLVALSVAAYLPFWRGTETVLEPFRAMTSQTLVPGGSVVDVVGELGSMLRKGDSFDPNMPVVERVARQRAARESIWRMAQRVMSLVSLVALLPLFRALFRKHDEALVAPASGVFVIVALTLASPKFQSWYLMSALPFFALSCPPAWRRWWPWVIFAAVTQEFPLALPRNAALFMPAVGFGTGLTVIVFLGSFRQRYYRWQETVSDGG